MTTPVAVSRQSKVPVTAAVDKFSVAESQAEQPRTDASNKNSTGIFIIFGILFLLLVALVMTSFNQDREVVADRSATAITAPVSMPAEIEIEPGSEPELLPVPTYQASVSQDAEGIVITIDAAADELLEQKADSESTNVTLKEETPADSPLNLAAPIPAPKEKIIVHVVVKGDTLWDIAKRYVRNPWRYPELARLSNIKNPHRIYPGNKVKIIMRATGKTEPVESRIKSK
jgi:nucleoid-associated protein YgaU